ncbi:MAG: UDP-N-acetylmuramoyl-L-alanyl-D-glutamate--2,6-diaminopimelate ligase [Betaproteobacteria bacterium RIFCSPLOWO2_12_FULL_68_20]|nr:MAG: UDP-N-acetylmuramoyl-L-alanyl-D-glutamate--2,6-diaminopimelate ligase [Betaproteobacteria bacterium RIFCSPLOWO2_12_FULL_68_20]
MIERLSPDSRRCAPGVAFFAFPGDAADGRAHIPEALARGAAAVLWEEDGFSWRQEWRVPNAAVRGLRQQAGRLAHEFYGRPSADLWVCGVTGTNGKTSCTQWLAAALGARGEKTGVIGTLGGGFPGALAELATTTPDALELHRMLADMRHAGARAVAMEVSSHALVQGRVNGVAFACALFTNLSHEHLDYHGSMEAYAEAKARLFDAPGAAVLNLDDVLGVRLAQRLAARGLRTIGYSLSAGAVAPGSVREYVAARAIEAGADATRVALESSWGAAEFSLSQLGRYSAANALGVLGCLLAHGVPFAQGVAALESLPQVPGRMQRVGGAGEPLVVIDYAHTPDALEKVLQALRPVAVARGGRLVAVFGAGGDRDRSKRSPMGAVAARLADRVVLTSDNPRSEDPRAILEAIRVGVPGPCELEPDRARAIERALTQAAAADVLLLAGKGHETWQEIAGERLPFSDAQAARAALERRRQR